MVQIVSVITRTRGILRRCAPQDDNLFVILNGGRSPQRRISRLRGSISHPPLRGGSVPSGGQSEVGGMGAQCAPLWGGSQSPSYCDSKWVAAARRNNAYTRAARPEGKEGD